MTKFREWGPAAAAIFALFALLWFLHVREMARDWYAATLLGALAWTGVALSVALGAERRQLAARLASPGRALAFATMGLLVAAVAAAALRLTSVAPVVFAIAAAHACWAAAQPFRRALSILVVSLISMAMIDAVLWSFHHVPALSSIRALQPIGRWVFVADFESISSVDCFVWDAELTYRFRAGGCEYVDPEYTVRYETNSLGARDDEASLDRPDIVVLGDSFAVGTGVPQRESFPERLEDLSGRKVLNLAVTSYGTFRSLRLLARNDLSHKPYIVIQYCGNDSVENRNYASETGRPPMAREMYYRITREWVAGFPYHFGKYSTIFYDSFLSPATLAALRGAGLLGASELPGIVGLPAEWKEPDVEEVRDFLRVMETSRVDLTEFHLFVTELNSVNELRPSFLSVLEEEWKRSGWGGTYTIVDVESELTPEDYFLLDPHINTRGHEKVARRLWEAIREYEAGGGDSGD